MVQKYKTTLMFTDNVLKGITITETRSFYSKPSDKVIKPVFGGSSYIIIACEAI